MAADVSFAIFFWLHIIAQTSQSSHNRGMRILKQPTYTGQTCPKCKGGKIFAGLALLREPELVTGQAIGGHTRPGLAERVRKCSKECGYEDRQPEQYP